MKTEIKIIGIEDLKGHQFCKVLPDANSDPVILMYKMACSHDPVVGDHTSLPEIMLMSDQLIDGFPTFHRIGNRHAVSVFNSGGTWHVI